MKISVKGTLIEKYQKLNKDGQIIDCIRIHQEGQRNLYEIKNYTTEEQIGAQVHLYCEIFPWTFQGKTGLALKAL